MESFLIKYSKLSKKPPILINRFIRNLLFYTYGSFSDTPPRLFTRNSRKPLWCKSYSAALYFTKFCGNTQKSKYLSILTTKSMRKNLIGTHSEIQSNTSFFNPPLKNKFFFTQLKVQRSSKLPVKVRKPERRIQLVELPFRVENLNFDKTLILVPSDLAEIVQIGKIKINILLNSTLDFSISKQCLSNNVINIFLERRYGFKLVQTNDGDFNYSNIILNSSLKRQGNLQRKNFPDINKSTRPTGPENNLYSTFKSFFLVLRFFPILIITFRASNLFFVLSSPDGKVLFSHSVGLGGEFKKASRRSVSAYDSAAREFAKKVKMITSIVGLRIHGQSTRRYYVLRNLKKVGLRFIFLQDIIPFACNGVRKARRARKRKKR
jgi:ribosomal protein S11